jgi:hypothetical protein
LYFIACKEKKGNEKPANILKKEVMVDVLCDIHLTDALLQLKSNQPKDFIHLNSTCISQMIGKPYNAWETVGGNIQGGADLTAHYHVAKGSTFKTALNIRNTFEEEINHIISQNKYGLGINSPGWSSDPEKFYWCAEENYSSETLFNNLKAGKYRYKGFHYDITDDTIDRSKMIQNEYQFDINKLLAYNYINIHCLRPYSIQEQSLLNILKVANII